MYKCECGREFTTPHGFSRHKKTCGEIRVDKHSGYQYFLDSDGKVVHIHRHVMEQKLGRKLKRNKIVHHDDENKLNNDSDNLSLTSYSGHAKIHYKGMPRPKNQARGSSHGHSKLSEDDVLNIRNLYHSGYTQMEISKMYNVSHKTIWDVINRTWKHLSAGSTAG